MKKGLLTASLLTSAMAVSSWQMASARDWPMFGEASATEATDFGHEIGPQTITDDLASSRSGLDDWESANPAEVAHVRHLIGQE